jgi:hypothetical protein
MHLQLVKLPSGVGVLQGLQLVKLPSAVGLLL